MNAVLDHLPLGPDSCTEQSGAQRLAVLCYHTSPLGQPGGRDAGGMNVYVQECARALAARGCLVDIFTRVDGTEPCIETLVPGVRLVRIAAGPPRPAEKSRLAAFLDEFVAGVAAFRIHEGIRYDLIHSHYWLSGLAGLQLQRRWQVPHVTMFHTLGAAKNRARAEEREPAARIDGERLVAQSVDRIVCATEHERTVLERLYQAPGSSIVTVPCGVDVDRFHPANKQQARRSLGIAERPVVLYVGRIEPLKGLDVAIEVLAHCKEQRPLLIVVGGDRHSAGEVRRLRARAAAAGVAGQLCFVGPVPQADLPRYYVAADVCLVPSYYESFGMAALEAQACGVPVIASRVGGLPGVVREGETGFLVPWQCADEFAARLDLLLRDTTLRHEYGRAARTWALHFRWDDVAQRLLEVYAALAPADSCHPLMVEWLKVDHVRCDVA